MLSRGTTWPFLFFLQMKISTRTFVHWYMPPHLEMTVKYDQYWCTHVHKHYSQYWLLHCGVSACLLACLLGTNPRSLTNRTFSREYLVVFMHILLLLHKCISEFLEVLYETCETSTRTLCIFVGHSEAQTLYGENYVNLLDAYFQGWYLNFNIVECLWLCCDIWLQPWQWTITGIMMFGHSLPNVKWPRHHFRLKCCVENFE
jgi:hypothetical protein